MDIGHRWGSSILSLDAIVAAPRVVQIETGWAKMGMKLAWRVRRSQTLGEYIVRIVNGVEQHVPMSTITSHFKKRGATSQLAWSGASGAEVTKCCTHSNVASKNLYLRKQAVDMVPVRQLLNAPPGMLQAGETPALAASPPQSGAVLGATIRRVRSLHVMAGRAFSNLDVFTEVKRTSSVTQELLVLQRTAEQSGLLQLVHQQQATIASLAMALSSFAASPALSTQLAASAAQQVTMVCAVYRHGGCCL